MYFQTATFPMTLSDVQGHLPIACLFKCACHVHLCSFWQDCNWQQRGVRSHCYNWASCRNIYEHVFW